MKSLDLAKKLIHDAKAIKKTRQNAAQINDLVQKAVKEQVAAMTKNPNIRKGVFNTSLAVRNPNTSSERSLDKSLMSKSTKVGDTREFQKACDDIYVTSIVTGLHPTELDSFELLKSTKIYKDATTYETADFLDTSWWPNTLSRDMIEQVEAELKVAALHRTIQMPTNPYKIPSKTGRTTTYLVGESTDETGVTPPSSVGPTPADGILFDAKKLMAYSVISEESTEDLVIPIIGMIKEDIAKSMAEAIEESTINGQKVADTIDTQLGLGGNDARRAWNGHRVHAFGGGWTVDLAAWSASGATDLLRKMRATMGRYGVNPAKLAWVVSINGYNQMLKNDDMRTIDKYGSNATLITGEMGRFDNIPVIISEFIPENLNASGAYTSDTDNDYTTIELVYADGFAHGERSKFTIKQGEEIKTDQKFIVSRARRDFQPLYKGATFADSIICVGFGLPNDV